MVGQKQTVAHHQLPYPFPALVCGHHRGQGLRGASIGSDEARVASNLPIADDAA